MAAWGGQEYGLRFGQRQKGKFAEGVRGPAAESQAGPPRGAGGGGGGLPPSRKGRRLVPRGGGLSPLARHKKKDADAAMRHWSVVDAFGRECEARGAHQWAAHPEGRHCGLSGAHFVRALATEAGRKATAAAAHRFGEVLEEIEAAGGGALAAASLVRLLRAADGVIIRVGPRRGARRRAGPYFLMDAARQVWLWAAGTGKIAAGPLEGEAFEAILAAQSGTCRRALVKFGAGTASSFEHRRASFEAVMRAAEVFDEAPAPAPGGFAPAPAPGGFAPALDLAGVPWPLFLVHVCEYGQVRRRYRPQQLRLASGAGGGISSPAPGRRRWRRTPGKALAWRCASSPASSAVSRGRSRQRRRRPALGGGFGRRRRRCWCRASRERASSRRSSARSAGAASAATASPGT